jgi:hypothetical protein
MSAGVGPQEEPFCWGEMGVDWPGPSAHFAIIFAGNCFFLTAQYATKYRTCLGRSGIRFSAPKIITKEQKFRENLQKMA